MIARNRSHETPDTLRPLMRSVSRRVNLAVWLNRTLPGVGVLTARRGPAAVLICKMLCPALAPWAAVLLVALPALLVYGYLDCKKRKRFFSPLESPNSGSPLPRRRFGQRRLRAAGADCRGSGLIGTLMREIAEPPAPASPLYYLKKVSAGALVLLVAALLIPARPPDPLPPGRRSAELHYPAAGRKDR